jgi:hypothetical protein
MVIAGLGGRHRRRMRRGALISGSVAWNNPAAAEHAGGHQVDLIPMPDLLESNGMLAFDSSDNGLGTGFLM